MHWLAASRLGFYSTVFSARHPSELIVAEQTSDEENQDTSAVNM
jgi:hypothetical protein